MKIKTKLSIISGHLAIAPLVDVVFLLLIFFIMSSSLVFHQGIAVELPTVKIDSTSAAEKIVITLTRNSLLFFNDNPVEWDDLERQLGELAYESKKAQAKRLGGIAEGSRETPKVLLRADANVSYGKIVEVMSLARSLNLGVYLATSQKRQPPTQRSPLTITNRQPAH